MCKANLNIWLLVWVLVVVLAGPVGAVTYYVNPGESIQAAIDAASNGDEIEVAPDIYNEAIDFNGKAVRLYSSGGPAVTTIDAIGLESSVVMCINGEDANTVLEGFTITGGTGTPDEYTQLCGGGMRNESSSPTVTNCTFTGNSAGFGGGVFNYAGSAIVSGCTFTNNTASRWGAGLYNNDSSPTVTNCTFSGNTTTEFGGGMYNGNSSNPTVTDCNFTNNSAKEGGGMHNGSSSSPTVINCTFSGNTASPWGGGMYNHNSSPTVTNCTFTGNTAVTAIDPGRGGGMFNNWYSSPTVTNCIFIGNSSDYYGGGMSNYDYSSPTVTNCTFTDNTAKDDGGGMYNASSSPTATNCVFNSNIADGTAYNAGGGMYNIDNSNPTLTNCTFIGNSADDGGGIYNYHGQTVTNCIFWGNVPQQIAGELGTVNYSCIQGILLPGTGNINTDPLFVNAAGGDFRLSSSASPCVDTGDNSVPGLPATDLAGNLRIADGDLDGTATVDMGAYEFQSGLIHNITQDLWYATIQAAINAAANGDEIEVSPGRYYEAVIFLGKAVRLYSSGGPNVTTIDGTGHYHVVLCVNGEGANTILEGFTITGGSANGSFPNDCGGGMFNWSSSPTVTNCTFSGNSTSICGGGMFNYDNSSPTVTDCTFSGNSTSIYGGGMFNGDNSNPTVTNCILSNNTAEWGGGMCNGDSSPMLTNCILWGNTAPNDPQISGDSPTVTYSDVQGGWPGTGNIDADPCFVDSAAGNLRLQPDSPCIDAGDTTAVSLPLDLDGNPRAIDNPHTPNTGLSVSDSLNVVDMGAYEFHPCRIAGDINCDGVVDFKDLAILCGNWLAGKEPEL